MHVHVELASLVVLDRLLGEQLLNLVYRQALKRRLNNAVEEKSKVDEESEADHL